MILRFDPLYNHLRTDFLVPDAENWNMDQAVTLTGGDEVEFGPYNTVGLFTSGQVEYISLLGNSYNAGTFEIVSDAAASSGKALHISGQQRIVFKVQYPYDESLLKKVVVRAKKVSGTLYAGVVGYKGDDLFNKDGLPSLNDYYKVTLAGGDVSDTVYSTFKGYIKLFGTAVEPAPSPDAPSPLEDGTTAIAMILECDGEYYIDSIGVQEVENTIADIPDGAAALSYVIVTGDQIFVYETGETTPTQSSIVLSAELSGGLSDYQWKYWTGSTWVNLGGTSTNQTYTFAHDNTAWGSSRSIRIACFSGSMHDEITIAKVYDGEVGPQGIQGNPGEDGSDGTDGTDGADGLHGILVILDNHAHSVPSSYAGVVLSYTDSGGKIQAFEGSTALSAVSSITTNSQFTIGTPVVAPSGHITVGGRSYSGTIATIANHSGMNNSTDLVTITYPVNVRRANGNDLSFSVIQTITKSKEGEKGDPGEDAYQLAILSTRGNLFRPDELETTLQVRVYKGGVNVTDQFDAADFRWSRESDNPESDDVWNSYHYSLGGKTIQVTTDDVYRRAVFNCTLLNTL